MDSAAANSEPRFFPSLVQAYIFGTLSSAVALHFAISLIAPGDGGTMLALGSGAILFTILVVLGIIGIVAFPIAAIISWPLRRLVLDRPILAFVLSVLVGTGFGAILTATAFQVGPDDFYSGPVVGFVYGFVWFLVVRARWRMAKVA